MSIVRRIIKNITNRGVIDIFNPKRGVMFASSIKRDIQMRVQGKKRVELLKKDYPEVFKEHYLMEQVAFRMTQIDCRVCLSDGECTHCGCKTPDLFFEGGMECSGLNWGMMMDRNTWTDYKDGNKVIINPDYIAQIKRYGKIINF